MSAGLLLILGVFLRPEAVLAECEPCGAYDPGWGQPPLSCTVPEVIVMGPGANFPGNPIGMYIVTLVNCEGPLTGVRVEVEFSSETMDMVAWCGAPPPVVTTAFTNGSGHAFFEFHGSGCIREGDPGSPSPWVAEVRAVVDGQTYVLAHPTITSPDAVDSQGIIPVESGHSVCESGMASAGVADAVFHTAAISMALREPCSKVTSPYGDPVGVLDAVFLSQYLAAGSACTCQ